MDEKEMGSKTIKLDNTKNIVHIASPCLICGESVTLTECEEMQARHHSIVKVCDKCKSAVMAMREIQEKKKQCSLKESGWCKNCASYNFCDIKEDDNE